MTKVDIICPHCGKRYTTIYSVNHNEQKATCGGCHKQFYYYVSNGSVHTSKA